MGEHLSSIDGWSGCVACCWAILQQAWRRVGVWVGMDAVCCPLAEQKMSSETYNCLVGWVGVESGCEGEGKTVLTKPCLCGIVM